MRKVIEVNNLTKIYKDFKAVDNLSFNVFEGEIVGLLGPNGSGKSTTINSILSLIKYNEGSIKVFGKEMRPDAYDLKREIGVVFQNVAVFEELNVYDNIDYFCGLYVKDKSLRKSYVDDAIKLVGLVDFKKFYPKELSGGLLRRLNIACGIAHKPKIIFFDEPTAQVDPQSRNHILDNIIKLKNEGASIVYTTHYMEEVELLCDNIIIIDKGKIIAKGTSDELKGLLNIEEKVSVLVKDLDNKFVDMIKVQANVESVHYKNDTLLIVYKKGKDNLSKLMDFFKNNGIHYENIFSLRPTLNDVFLELTGKELRD